MGNTPVPSHPYPTPPPAHPLPVIPDHKLIRPIGGGSYGEVWLARNALDAYRAVKIVHRHNFEHDRPFEREFEGIQKFEPISRSHEGLVDLLQVGRNDAEGYFYYVMELADALEVAGEKMRKREGETEPASDLRSQRPAVNSALINVERYVPKTLRSLLRSPAHFPTSPSAQTGRLPLDECIQFGLSLTSALTYLHGQGLVHRDIKPSNIIFVGGVPKLADVGLVAGVGEARSYVGTEGFIPPEGPGSPQADLYSLGIVLYEMSTGKRHQDFPEPLPDLAAQPDHTRWLEFNAVIHKACRAEVRERYQSAEEMRSELELLQLGQSVRRLRLVERRLAMATKVGVALGALALIAVAAYFGAVRQAQRARRAERAMAQQLYVSDLNRAYQFWDKGNVRQSLDLLEKHGSRSLEKEDLRSFEWFYLWQLCHNDNALHTFLAHTGAIVSLAFSRDGSLLATGSDDGTANLWNVASQQKIGTLTNFSGFIQLSAFAPDGKPLACGNEGGAVVLRDIATKQAVAALAETDISNSLVVLSTNGKLLATLENDGDTVVLWDTASRSVLDRLKSEEGGYLYSVAFSPDGKILVAGHRDNLVTFWETSTRRKMADLEVPVGFVSSLAFSPDNRTLALAGIASEVVFCDVASLRITAVLAEHENQVTSVAFSPDGQTVATASSDTTVKLWNATTHQLVATLKGHLDGGTAMAFAPDGKTIASGCADGSVKLWAVAPKPDLDVLVGHTNWARSVAFSPDGKTLASAGKDKTVRLWDVTSGQLVATLQGHQRPAYRVAWSPDGKTLATVSGLITEEAGLGEVKLWDAIGRKELVTLTNQSNPVCSVAFSLEGHILATGNGNGSVMLWNTATHAHVATLHAHKDHVNSVAFSANGKILASGSDDNTAKLWDVTTRRELAVIPGSVGNHRDTSYAIWSVAFSPDGRTLALGNDDGTVMLWSLTARKLVGAFKGTAGKANSVAFAPDGRTLIVGNQDNVVTLWNVATCQEMAVLKGHKGFIESVALSPDGSRLASASFDKTVRLWRAATRAETDAGAKAK